MKIKQKIYIPKPNPSCELDGTVMFFGNEEEIERYQIEETRIFRDWKNLLIDIINNRIRCISIDYPHTICTLSPGIEKKNTVRYSNFFKMNDGQLDAILHHEYAIDELDELIKTYLFSISRDSEVKVADIIEELSPEWQVVPECNLKETGEHTEWSRQTGKQEFWWIDKKLDGFEVVDSQQNILYKCKTFNGAKRWADKRIEMEYDATVLEENDEYRLVDVGLDEYELRDLDDNFIATTFCETIVDALEELQNQNDLSI